VGGKGLHFSAAAAALCGDGGKSPLPSPSPAYLKVRVRSGLLEVWGECTYAVKEELKKLKFRWDSDDGRKCWWQKVDDDQEEEKVKREVKKLADSRAFAYLLAA
jgi:hypothetical protein